MGSMTTEGKTVLRSHGWSLQTIKFRWKESRSDRNGHPPGGGGSVRKQRSNLAGSTKL